MSNPLFETWTTPFDRIHAEHFPPDFDHGMAENIAEIEAITGNPDAPTFANTIEAMERNGRFLNRVSGVFWNLNSRNTTDVLETIARDYAPKFAQHSMRIALDPALFARIADLYERRATLDLAPDQLRLPERQHLGFVRSGALLPPDAKARMTAITKRLATLHTLFGQFVGTAASCISCKYA